MKRRFFLIIMTLVLVLTLGACSLEGKEVELGVSASYQNEMVEGSAQQVEIEVADSTLNLEELAITWESSNPEIAEVTKDGLVKANKPGEVTIDVTIVLGEAKKELALEITVVEVVYVIEYELDGGQNSELNPAGFGGSLLPIELQPATKLGYKFLGWEYEGEFVEKLEVARNYKLVAKWELEEYSISYDVAGGEYEGEATESYTVHDTVELPAPTKDGYEFLGWYAGEEKVEKVEAGSTGNLELVANWKAVEYSISYDLAGGAFEEGAEAQESYTIEDAVEFLLPVKEGHRFLGWYAGEEKVAGIEKGSKGDVSVVAKWEAGYYIDFKLDGGAFEGLFASYDDFVETFFAEYVKVCQAEQENTITKDTFVGNSHPSIKTFFGDAERLAKYQWLLRYVDSELREYNAGNLKHQYVADTLTMLELMLKGDTAAISASGYGPNGRTLLRNFIHGIINKNKGGKSEYIPYTPDFSSEAQQADFLAAEGAPFINEFYPTGSELPVPAKEGYLFDGWYNEAGEKVVAATEGGTLTAHWRDYYVIEFDLAGGQWEGLYTSIQEIGEAFLADFNSYGGSTLTKELFFKNSTPPIKIALTNAEMLAKWNWLFAYMLEDLVAYNTANGKLEDSYVKVSIANDIPAIVAGDTGAIVNSNGANTRTLVRAYLAGVMNLTKGSTGQDGHNSEFTKYVPDFSLEENQKALLAAYLEAHTPSKIKVGAELPTNVKGATRFLGWVNEAGEVVTIAEADGKLTAKWEVIVVKSLVTFVLDGGQFAEGIEIPTEYEEGKGLASLPTPTKEGYKFLGWYLGEEAVEGISAEQKGDVELAAKWEEIITDVEDVLNVGPNETYKTIEEALLAAKPGATIRLTAGTYGAVVINKSVIIEGANAGVNPNVDKRGAESVFNADITISADDVVIDGIQLVGLGRIVGGAEGCANTIIRNVWSYQSTLNLNNLSTNAPFYFSSSAEGVEYYNLTLSQVRISDPDTEGAQNRPMVAYLDQVNGLIIENSVFAVRRNLYNDAVKTGSAAGAYGVKGNVEIIGNRFENFAQYVLWFDRYAEGTFTIQNNEFVECGQTAGSHCAVRFGEKYSGSEKGITSINFSYNTVDNSYMLVRIDAVANRTAETQIVKINYNKLLNCQATYYVKNANGYDVDATNNYYDVVPTEDKFLNATWEPYYANVADVPEYVPAVSEYKIEYVLNGGTFGDVSYEVTIDGAAKKEFTIGKWYSDGKEYAESFVMASTDIVSQNSLRWQNKIVVKYVESLNAYEVVYVDDAVAKVNELDVEWTHVFASLTESALSYAQVGQYIVLASAPSEDMANVAAKVYDASQIKSTEKVETVEVPTKYTKNDLPLELPVPTLSGKEFYGWYKTADFSDEIITVIPKGTVGDITLYARFVEPGWVEPTFGSVSFELNGGMSDAEFPEQYQFGVELELPVLTKEGYIFLGWTMEENSDEYMSKLPANVKNEELVLYAQFKLNAVYVGEGKDYATITEALNAATEGTKIVVSAGTYEEEIEINVNGVQIIGTTEGDAMTTLNSIVINANNVVVQGVKLTATTGIQVKGGKNITIKESKLGAAPTGNNQSMLLVNGETEGLSILDCEFVTAQGETGNTHYRAYYSSALVKDVTIRGNLFKNNLTFTGAAGNYYVDGVKFDKVAGHVIIEDNDFDWPGDNFTLYVKGVQANAVVNIINNKFETAGTMSGMSVRDVVSSSTINVIGNSYSHAAGTVIEVRGNAAKDTTTTATVNIKNNALKDTSSKVSIGVALTNLSIDNNYFFQEVNFSNNDASSVTTNNAADAESALAGIVSHNVTFVTNGGVIYGDVPTKFVEGTEIDLTKIIPTLSGMRLVGWYANAEFTGEPVLLLGSQTSDVTLYAKYEPIPVYNVTYELAGGEAEGLVTSAYEGTVIDLPVPELFGATFLGWSLEKGSTDYVTYIELTENTTVYANWTTAEVYEVTYVLNGGSIKYPTRDALVNDFIKDYSYAMGKAYKTASDIPTGSFAEIDYHTFFTKTLEDGTPVRDKWLWLAEHIYELSARDLASNNCNVLGLKALINNSSYSGDAIYGVSYAFRAFLIGTTIRPDTSYTSVNFSIAENANAYWSELSKNENAVYKYYGETKLPQAYSGAYTFVGWYDNAEFTGEPVTVVTEGATLYAKFGEGVKVESIAFDNAISEIKRYETHQLKWTFTPAKPTIETVKFESSNPEVATVDENGLITAVANGIAVIKVISQAEGNKFAEFTLEVYSPDHFEFSYETESYVAIEGTIELNAEYVKRDGSASPKLVWSSKNPEIAAVDQNGFVTGLAEGLANIRVSVEGDADTYLDIYVTVLPQELSAALQFVVDEHESNVFTKYELGIGAGTPAYYSDIYGSVNQFLFNKELEINDKYLANGNASNDYYKDSNIEEGYGGIQFVTVHYTAGFDSTADTDNHASYFTGGSADVSIHYVTGNKGLDNGEATSEIYKTLDHSHGAWHAGDSNGRFYSNSTTVDANGWKRFMWIPTGVAYDGCDLSEIKWTASEDFYFELNGKKTSIALPEVYNYKERGTNHIMNADGTYSSTETLNSSFSWIKFENRTPESFFTDQGFVAKVIDGEYYMAPTWWSYGQVIEGRICTFGGNLNSIGIESCVNKGSDLWFTWQITAKLVAKLLDENNLTIDRVKGHYFFDGKDCPQPLLENDMQIWYEFIELVKAELEARQELSEYTFEFTSNNPEIISENGRVIKTVENATSATYTVKVMKGGEVVDTITLASMVPSVYAK